MFRNLDLQTLTILVHALESPDMCVSGAALERFQVAAGKLRSRHLFKAQGYEALCASPTDTPVALNWLEDGRQGYFDEEEGWIDVTALELTRYSVDTNRLLTALTSRLTLKGGGAEKIPGHLWELGSTRLVHRTQSHVLWFARRLAEPDVWLKVKEVLRASQPLQSNILLTSTRRAQKEYLPRTTMVLIADVVSTETFAVDQGRLDSVLGASSLPPDSKNGLSILAGGREVHFKGKVFSFKGLKQREIVAALQREYLNGARWVSSAKILGDLRYDETTRIRDVFKKNEAWGVLLIERDGMCGFCSDD